MTATPLPYIYETDTDPIQLQNGIERQMGWEYSVERSSQVHIANVFQPLIVERLRRKVTYRFDNYVILYAAVHKWQYMEASENADPTTMYGYNFYHEGLLKKDGVNHLQPEIGIMFGFSPDEKKIPAYIESTPLAEIRKLLAEIEEKYQDKSALNAWMPAPVAAPTTAPQDIYQTMQQMRGEFDLEATRGRGRMINHVMRVTGVELGVNGWMLTPQELAKREGIMQAEDVKKADNVQPEEHKQQVE